MGDFESWMQGNNEVARVMFSNFYSDITSITNPIGQALTSWYLDNAWSWDIINYYIKFSFKYIYKSGSFPYDYLHIKSMSSNLLLIFLI